MYFGSPQPQCATGSIHGDVPGPNHGDTLTYPHGRVPVGKVKGLHQVHPRQELVGTVDAVQVFTGDIHHDRQAGASPQKDRGIRLAQLREAV